MATARKTKVEGRLWLTRQQQGFLGQGRLELLRRIGAQGSISAAAKAMAMSYKAAWDAIDAMNNLADAALVSRERGGKRGGGARLTEAGRMLLSEFAAMQQEHDRFVARLNGRLGNGSSASALARRLAFKTSARNQYWGVVDAIRNGGVNSEVALRISPTHYLYAVITKESVTGLGLDKGAEACALIKASAVILAPAEPALRTSARNRLEGTVVRTVRGPVNSTVTLDLGDNKTLTAVITRESLKALGTKPGMRACGLIKASHVILAVAQ